MLTKRRAAALAAAITLGLVTGWFTARSGGSLERAPTALLVMTIGLGSTGFGVGALLGRINDKAGTWVSLLLMLLSYYLGTMVSPFHSLAGDILLMTCSSMPACLATAIGFATMRASKRSRST